MPTNHQCSCTTSKNTQCSFHARGRKKFCDRHKECKRAWMNGHREVESRKLHPANDYGLMKKLFEGFMNIIATDNNNNTTKLVRIVAISMHLLANPDLDPKLITWIYNLANLMSGHPMTDDEDFPDNALALLNELCSRRLPDDAGLQKAFNLDVPSHELSNILKLSAM